MSDADTSAQAERWDAAARRAALERAAREGVDLLVIGGGITGAGVLRDAASRGMRPLLVERDDFGAGTSSRSSKMIHGGIRYIGEGQLRVVREACRERDRLAASNPYLVRPLPFVFPAYGDSKIPMWQVRALMWIYAAIAGFRNRGSTGLLGAAETLRRVPGLRADGLRGAGVYLDAQVDDARLVLETVKSARRLGAEALNHAEVVELDRDANGRVTGAVVRDRRGDDLHRIAARAVVNAAGPSVERVRGLDCPVEEPELRPAKGIHLVVPRARLPLDHAVVVETEDGRHAFVCPWEDVMLIGTTDAFSDEIDEPAVHIEEVHYLLGAVNRAFPRAGLTTNDLRSVFAGVRPLAASGDADSPSTSVSREDRIYRDPSGLLSVAGGKLTTYRAMGERIVDLLLESLPPDERRRLGRSRTAELPLRDDGPADGIEAKATALAEAFALTPGQADHLVRRYGDEAERLLAEVPAELHEPIGSSCFSYAEIGWALRRECALGLCDVLERRMRLALFAEGQGLPELDRIARAAADAGGWDDARTAREIAEYTSAVRLRYQISAVAAAVRRPGRAAA